MANPVIVPCTGKAWTKIATNVTSGIVHLQKAVEQSWYQTYRDTGDSAPSGLAEIIPFGKDSKTGQTEVIDSAIGIDVYVYPSKRDGEVRVDLI